MDKSADNLKGIVSDKLMALDVGDRWVGVAFAPGGVVIPHSTLSRKGGEAEKALVDIISERQIELVVAGLPLSDDNQENSQSERVRRFCRRLSRRANVEIVFEDEYLSSQEAEEKLKNSFIKRGRTKQVVDAIAASIILSRYLDRVALTL
jgi:putative holliday junction resolvase